MHWSGGPQYGLLPWCLLPNGAQMGGSNSVQSVVPVGLPEAVSPKLFCQYHWFILVSVDGIWGVLQGPCKCWATPLCQNCIVTCHLDSAVGAHSILQRQYGEFPSGRDELPRAVWKIKITNVFVKMSTMPPRCWVLLFYIMFHSAIKTFKFS
jgi:hypothetical protein